MTVECVSHTWVIQIPPSAKQAVFQKVITSGGPDLRFKWEYENGYPWQPVFIHSERAVPNAKPESLSSISALIIIM